MIPQKEWKTAYLGKKNIAQDMVELRIERPSGFNYLAGQFVQFFVPTTEGTVLRAYSLASHPAQSDLEFCLKLVPSGRASTYFSNLAQRETIAFQGPNGRFICESKNDPISCIATGAGLAPIWGIIADELKNKKTNSPIRLLFGVRGEEDVFWTDRLQTLAEQYQNFSYILTLSQPQSAWSGKAGRVTTHLNTMPSEGLFYLCGNADMVKEVRALLINKNIPPTNIHFEIF